MKQMIGRQVSVKGLLKPVPRDGEIGRIVDTIGIVKYVVEFPDGERHTYETLNCTIQKTEAETAKLKAKEVDAKAKAEAKRDADAKESEDWQEALKTGFGMKWRVVRSQKSAVGKPNETFWKYWKSRKNTLLAMDIRVSKNTWGWEVEIPTCGDEYYRDHIQFGTHKIYFSQLEGTPKTDNSDAEVMRDDLEKGLHSPNAASELRAETPDEYDARRDYEEDGIGGIGRI